MTAFPSVVSGYDAIVAGNRSLPESLRQMAVLLSFAEPLRSHHVGEFLRIHLTEQMLDDGEESFYQAEVFQPARAAPRLCRSCGDLMRRISPVLSTCHNPRCAARGKRVNDGPVRGVVDVLVFPDFVVDRTIETVRVPDPSRAPSLADVLRRRVKLSDFPPTPTVEQPRVVEWVDRCVLVLDRRYNSRTLAGVYRTAGMLCDQKGWRLSA